MELPYDPVTPLLHIDPNEMELLSQRDNCPLMFIAPLFIIGKTWKRPVSNEVWMDKRDVYNALLFSNEKKEILPFVAT